MIVIVLMDIFVCSICKQGITTKHLSINKPVYSILSVFDVLRNWGFFYCCASLLVYCFSEFRANLASVSDSIDSQRNQTFSFAKWPGIVCMYMFCSAIDSASQPAYTNWLQHYCKWHWIQKTYSTIPSPNQRNQDYRIMFENLLSANATLVFVFYPKIMFLLISFG